MATLNQVRNKADAKLADFWQKLSTLQNAYHAKHGKYFQLLVTGGRNVGDSQEYPLVLRSPSDEKYAIDIDTNWTDSLPFEIQVNEWVGPNGVGYKAIVVVEWNGRTFSRHRDSDQNDSGWFEVIEEEFII